jgi:type IV pilus assembly protein PilA
MKQRVLRASGGFTLIELLIIIAILAILITIAIPQMAAYRRRSIDAQVRYDVKNAAIAQEAYFADMKTYAGNIPDLSGSRGFRQSANVNIVVSGTTGGFVVTATAISGCSASTGTWSVDSSGGQMVGTACN